MNTPVLALVCWIVVLAPGVRGKSMSSWPGKTAAVVCAVISLMLTPFWRNAELAGPEVAFVCVWVLVLLPVVHYRLDRASLTGSLVNGLVAAAFVGLAAHSTGVLGVVIGAVDVTLADIVVWLVVATLFLVGATVCLLISREVFPWDYAAWFGGGLLIARPALIAPLDKLNAAHGGLILLLAYLLLLGFWLGLRGRFESGYENG